MRFLRMRRLVGSMEDKERKTLVNCKRLFMCVARHQKVDCFWCRKLGNFFILTVLDRHVHRFRLKTPYTMGLAQELVQENSHIAFWKAGSRLFAESSSIQYLEEFPAITQTSQINSLISAQVSRQRAACLSYYTVVKGSHAVALRAACKNSLVLWRDKTPERRESS